MSPVNCLGTPTCLLIPIKNTIKWNEMKDLFWQWYYSRGKIHSIFPHPLCSCVRLKSKRKHIVTPTNKTKQKKLCQKKAQSCDDRRQRATQNEWNSRNEFSTIFNSFWLSFYFLSFSFWKTTTTTTTEQKIKQMHFWLLTIPTTRNALETVV